MQEGFCSASQFSRRTEALASALGCLLGDLPDKIGISERSLFGYRSGKYPISAKALRKLQDAEEAAGIWESSVLREDAAEYRTGPTPEKIPGMWEVMRMIKAQVAPHVADEVERLLMEHQRERLHQEANEFFGNAEALAAEAKRIGENLTDQDAAENLRVLSDAVMQLMPTVQTLVESLTKPKP